MSDKLKYKNNSKLNDAWIHGMIDAAMMLNKRLNKYDFKIVVKDQVVTLFGEVNTVLDKWLCKEILKGLAPIKSFNLQLTIVELELMPDDAEKLTSRELFLRLYTDISTTAEVKAKLAWTESLSGKELEVSTENGVVTIAGEVEYQANKAMAEVIVSNIVHVQEVRNKIIVNG